MSDHKFICIDTNILLTDASVLLHYEKDKTIILPEVVVDELDSKKSGFSELAFQAREVGRILAKATVLETVNKGLHTITTVDVGRTIQIITKAEYIATGEASILNDRKIIEIAFDFNALFLSNDVMARTRALSVGVKVAPLDLVDDADVPTFRTLDVDDVNTLEGTDIASIDEETSSNISSYHFKDASGNQALGIIINGKVSLIDEDELVRQEAAPINTEQKLLSHAILSGKFDILVTDSVAGSGKNIVTLSAALKLVKKKKFTKIYYIRNTVNNLDKAEEVGFLATNEAKFEQFYQPLWDTLRYFAEQSLKVRLKTMSPEDAELAIEEKVAQYVKKYNIEPISTMGLRGRTIKGIVIIDEAANFSPNSLQTTLTRVAKGSLVVVTGSQNQIDNPYLNKHNNGFGVLKAAANVPQSIKLFSISLLKVVRGPITEFAEALFSKVAWR